MQNLALDGNLQKQSSKNLNNAYELYVNNNSAAESAKYINIGGKPYRY